MCHSADILAAGQHVVETADPVTYYLYAIVESATTAGTPTLSAAKKQTNKQHRNINRRVSLSVFIATIKHVQR